MTDTTTKQRVARPRVGASCFVYEDKGVVRYVGAIAGKKGVFVGVELDQPKGRNDGSATIDGENKRYFTCPPNHGVFVPAKLISKQPVKKTARQSLAPQKAAAAKSGGDTPKSTGVRAPAKKASSATKTKRPSSARSDGSDSSTSSQQSQRSIRSPAKRVPAASPRSGASTPKSTPATPRSTASSRDPSPRKLPQPKRGGARPQSVAAMQRTASAESRTRTASQESAKSDKSDASESKAAASPTTPSESKAAAFAARSPKKPGRSLQAPRTAMSPPKPSGLKVPAGSPASSTASAGSAATTASSAPRANPQLEAEVKVLREKLVRLAKEKQAIGLKAKSLLKANERTTTDLEALVLDKAAIEEELEEKATQLEDLEATIEAQKLDLEILREELENARMIASGEGGEGSELFADLGRIDDLKAAVAKAVNESQKKEAQYQQKLKLAAKQLEGLKEAQKSAAELVKVEAELKEAKATIEDLQESVDTAGDHEAMVEILSDKILDLEDKNETLTNANAELKSMAEVSQDYEDEVAETIKELENEVQAKSEELADMRSRVDEESLRADDLQETIDNFRVKVGDLLEQNQKMADMLRSQQSRVAHHTASSGEAVHQLAELRRELAKVTSNALALRQSEIARHSSQLQLDLLNASLPSNISPASFSLVLYAFRMISLSSVTSTFVWDSLFDPKNSNSSAQGDVNARKRIFELYGQLQSVEHEFYRVLRHVLALSRSDEVNMAEALENAARRRNELIAAERALVRILSLLKHSQLADAPLSTIDLTPSMNALASFLKLHLPLSDDLMEEGEGENARLYSLKKTMALTRTNGKLCELALARLGEKVYQSTDLAADIVENLTGALQRVSPLLENVDTAVSSILALPLFSGAEPRLVWKALSLSSTQESQLAHCVEVSEQLLTASRALLEHALDDEKEDDLTSNVLSLSDSLLRVARELGVRFARDASAVSSQDSDEAPWVTFARHAITRHGGQTVFSSDGAGGEAGAAVFGGARGAAGQDERLRKAEDDVKHKTAEIVQLKKQHIEDLQRQSLLEQKLTFLQEMADKSKASSVENSVSQADFKKLVAERDQYKLKMSMLVKRAGLGSSGTTPTGKSAPSQSSRSSRSSGDSLSRPDDLAALRRRNVFLADAVRKTRNRAHELTKARNVQKLASLPKLPKVVRSKTEAKNHTALVEQLRKIQSVRVEPFMVRLTADGMPPSGITDERRKHLDQRGRHLQMFLSARGLRV